MTLSFLDREGWSVGRHLAQVCDTHTLLEVMTELLADFPRGWDRKVMATGAAAAAVKKLINHHIQPPVDDRTKILAAADRVYIDVPFFPGGEERPATAA